MAGSDYMLAIETSSRTGSVTLGCDADELRTIDLGISRRHAVDLLPAIDRLCGEAGIGARGIGQIAVSIGPGSFTGLRIGVTAAKVLGRYGGAELVGVDSLDVVATNVPGDPGDSGGAGSGRFECVAVALAAKRGMWFTNLYRYVRGRWAPAGEPCMATAEAIASQTADRIGVICDKPEQFTVADNTVMLEPSFAIPRSDEVWRIGRRLINEHGPIAAEALVPRYIREPDAEEVWRRRNAGG